MGSSLELDTEQLKELANRIEEIVSGQVPCVSFSEAIEMLAQTYASRLVKNLAKHSVDKKETSAVPDYARIDLQSVVHQEARKRVVNIALRVMKHPKSSIPGRFPLQKEVKGCYRFLNNKAVNHQWQEMINQIGPVPENCKWTTVGDRGADIFPFILETAVKPLRTSKKQRIPL